MVKCLSVDRRSRVGMVHLGNGLSLLVQGGIVVLTLSSLVGDLVTVRNGCAALAVVLSRVAFVLILRLVDGTQVLLALF